MGERESEAVCFEDHGLETASHDLAKPTRIGKSESPNKRPPDTNWPVHFPRPRRAAMAPPLTGLPMPPLPPSARSNRLSWVTLSFQRRFYLTPSTLGRTLGLPRQNSALPLFLTNQHLLRRPHRGEPPPSRSERFPERTDHPDRRLICSWDMSIRPSDTP
jgi:hypothetical protein